MIDLPIGSIIIIWSHGVCPTENASEVSQYLYLLCVGLSHRRQFSFHINTMRDIAGQSDSQFVCLCGLRYL